MSYIRKHCKESLSPTQRMGDEQVDEARQQVHACAVERQYALREGALPVRPDVVKSSVPELDVLAPFPKAATGQDVHVPYQHGRHAILLDLARHPTPSESRAKLTRFLLGSLPSATGGATARVARGLCDRSRKGVTYISRQATSSGGGCNVE